MSVTDVVFLDVELAVLVGNTFVDVIVELEFDAWIWLTKSEMTAMHKPALHMAMISSEERPEELRLDEDGDGECVSE